MIDLATVTCEEFSEHRDSEFILLGSGGVSLVVRLTEVTPWGEKTPGLRQGFALNFLGPREPLVAQGICTLSHPALGEFALFLVPLGPCTDGVRYEGVFN